MEAAALLQALHTAERLKDATRHCYTSGGRHESVAEHSWRISLMAYWISDEFPEADMNKVLRMCLIHDLGEAFTGDIPTFRMCLIHDLGEAFTGDIPTFLKTSSDEKREDELLGEWVSTLPEPFRGEMASLYKEMSERKTLEARIFKALDSLEALIQHNESDLNTWSENEYDLNMHYADDKVAFSPYLTALRELIRKDTIAKIEAESS